MRKRGRIEDMLPSDSWFRRYLDGYQITEPPRSFFLFSAMSVLGVALGRRIWLPFDLYSILPLMNVMLIGPSGTGKSTAAKETLKLLESLSEKTKPQIIFDAATPEKLHEDLFANPYAMIFVSELATMVGRQKYMEGMVVYLTNLLDFDRAERRTKGEGVSSIKNPTTPMIGCSTPQWLQDMLPDNATAGGFLPRFLIVYEEHKAKKISSPSLLLSKQQERTITQKRSLALQEFNHIVQSAGGEFSFYDNGAGDLFNKWYTDHVPEGGHLQPFADRARTHVLRMAMLIAVSCYRPKLTEEDLSSAIRLYEYAICGLQQAVVPYSVQGKLLNKVLQVLSTGPQSPVDIRRAMRNDVKADEADRLVTSLLQSRDVVRLPDGRYRRAL